MYRYNIDVHRSDRTYVHDDRDIIIDIRSGVGIRWSSIVMSIHRIDRSWVLSSTSTTPIRIGDPRPPRVLSAPDPGGSGPRRGPRAPGDPPWEGGVPDPPRGGSKNRHPLYQRLIKWQEGRFRQCRGALVYTFLNWSGKLAFFSPPKNPPRGPRPGPLLPRDLGCLPPTWDKARPYPRHTRLINAGNDKHVDMRRQPLGHLCLLCLRGRRHYSLKMLSKWFAYDETKQNQKRKVKKIKLKNIIQGVTCCYLMTALGGYRCCHYMPRRCCMLRQSSPLVR